MKNLVPLLLMLTIQVSAQQAIGILESPTIKCNISATGDLFNPFGDDELPGFEAPINSGIRPIYAANFWIAGISPDQQIKVAAEQYQTAGADWFTGPLTNDGSASTTEETQNQYNQIWSGNKAEVDAHIQHFNEAQPDPSYIVPQWMLNWPAHGNVAAGQDYFLAPFVDVNQNAVYEPESGDYPLFCGDRCLLWIFNDRGGIHSKTNGQSIGVQVIATAYTFDNPALSNRVYFNYVVSNKGTQTLQDTYVGWFTDFDLGNPADDYIGSWVSLNAMYAENGDTFDESNSTAAGYENDLAMSAFVLLSGPAQDADELDNPLVTSAIEALDQAGQVYPFGRRGYSDGIPDNEKLGLTKTMVTTTGTSNDQLETPVDYYNRLRGVWNDGAAVTYGENGLNPENPEASYMYPLNTDPYSIGTNGIAVDWWTEQIAGMAPGDKRAVASSGPFTFEPGETMSLDFAYVFVRDSQSFESLLNEIYYEIIGTHDHYTNEIMSCQLNDQTLDQSESVRSESKIFPNPCSDRMIIQSPEIGIQVVELYNSTGQLVLVQTGSQNLEINVQNIPSGLYSLSIKTENSLTRSPVIIQH